MTERLCHEHPINKCCNATVLECKKNKDGTYDVLLDRTVFFPESGGQLSDTGVINEATVLYAYESGDDVWHKCSMPFEVGQSVVPAINLEVRVDHTAQHTGEHIISGLAKKLFDTQNVGFHMSPEYVSIDMDKQLSSDEINELELAANEAIMQDVPITRQTYSTLEELDAVPLRKRAIGLKPPVYVVAIGDVDSCTCCGTHFESSARVGLIKITSFEKHKDGVRIFFVCGKRAVSDYRKKHDMLTAIAQRFSTNTNEIGDTVIKQLQEFSNLKREYKLRTQTLLAYIADDILKKAKPISGVKAIYYKDDTFTTVEAKMLADAVCTKEKCIAFVLSIDTESIRYVLARSANVNISMKDVCQAVNAALNGKGGGRDEFAQGSAPKRFGYEDACQQVMHYIMTILK